VTHEHDDHACGVAAFAEQAAVDVYCTAGTAHATGLADSAYWIQIRAGRRIEVGPLVVDPFGVPHDAHEPVQFVFSDGDRRAGLLTDAGEPSPTIVEALSRLHALLLECNHDVDMLRTGPYPPFLKVRIGGTNGHLSNAQAASILGAIDRRDLQWVAAAHLSKSNNTPQLARGALARVLGCPESEVGVADQDDGLGWRSV
jgi:phosphoribosyl 1,2-cyclic phosphodiesterase